MTCRKKVIIAIAFGTSFRDVLRNSLVKFIKESQDIEFCIVSPCIPDFIKHEFIADNVCFYEIPIYLPTIVERVLRFLQRSILRSRSNTIRLGNMGSVGRRLSVISPFIGFLENLFGYESLNSWVRQAYKKFVHGDPVSDLFDEVEPDLVVVSRVLNYSPDYAVLKSASFRGIPVISFVSSWDNFSGKGYFPFDINKIIVWNDIMKDEAKSLFSIPEDTISVTGIPRFDNYYSYLSKPRHELKKRHEKYLKKINNKKELPIITYCTGTKNWCKNKLTKKSPEPDLIISIYRSLRNRFERSFFFVIRLHPNSDIEPYNSLLGIDNIFIDVPGEKSKFADRVLKLEEELDLADTIMFSSVIMNYASTITLDCSALDKPFICINYSKDIPYYFSPQRLYDFDHYKRLIDETGIILCDSPEKMLNMVSEVIVNDVHITSEVNKKIREKFIKYTDGMSGYRNGCLIKETLYEV